MNKHNRMLDWHIRDIDIIPMVGVSLFLPTSNIIFYSWVLPRSDILDLGKVDSLCQNKICGNHGPPEWNNIGPVPTDSELVSRWTLNGVKSSWSQGPNHGIQASMLWHLELSGIYAIQINHLACKKYLAYELTTIQEDKQLEQPAVRSTFIYIAPYMTLFYTPPNLDTQLSNVMVPTFLYAAIWNESLGLCKYRTCQAWP